MASSGSPVSAVHRRQEVDLRRGNCRQLIFVEVGQPDQQPLFISLLLPRHDRLEMVELSGLLAHGVRTVEKID